MLGLCAAEFEIPSAAGCAAKMAAKVHGVPRSVLPADDRSAAAAAVLSAHIAPGDQLPFVARFCCLCHSVASGQTPSLFDWLERSGRPLASLCSVVEAAAAVEQAWHEEQPRSRRRDGN